MSLHSSALNNTPSPSSASYSLHNSQQPIQLETGWATIYSEGIQRLFNLVKSNMKNQHFSNKDYVRLYTIIYHMCIQKFPYCWTEQLYDRYQSSLDEFLTTIAYPEIEQMQPSNSLNYNKEKVQAANKFIEIIVKQWNNYIVVRKWLFNFFNYLDRYYVKRHGKKSLKQVAAERFKLKVYDEIKQKLAESICVLIQEQRESSVSNIDSSQLRTVVYIFIEMSQINSHYHSYSQTSSQSAIILKIYKTDLEKYFLSQTKAFYSRRAIEWLEHDSMFEYLRRVQAVILSEKHRINEILHQSTEDTLLNCLYNELLVAYQTDLLNKPNSGVVWLLQQEDSVAEIQLKLLYQLYAATQSLQPIASLLQSHIVQSGQQLTEKHQSSPNTENPFAFIESLIALHEKYFSLVKNCFSNHAVFQKALKEAFETLVNPKSSSPQSLAIPTAELLASYSDFVLKRGGLRLSDTQLQLTLDNIVRVFTYLIDKDLFSEFYRNLLAQRLLLQRSASSDAERLMIQKLKLRCGAQFTSKLEGMLSDMRSAQEHNSEFQAWLAERRLLDVELTVQALTSGFWPPQCPAPLNLPEQLQRCQEAFKAYYDSKTNNRRLAWCPELGSVTLRANFPKRVVDVVCTTVQATILYWLNQHDRVAIVELQRLTGLDPDTMKQQLKVLVNGKYKLLQKHPVEGYSSQHHISVNLSFVQPLRVIRLPAAVKKAAGSKDRQATNQTVTEDRKHAIEASIVRVMKSRKQLTHAQLMSQVTQQLLHLFQPDPKQIKQRIEDLITRDYLERDKEDSTIYHYLA